MSKLSELRKTIQSSCLVSESDLIDYFLKNDVISKELRENAKEYAIDLVKTIRSSGSPGILEVFLAEYGLSTDEGVALMCLAEAFLRVPDASTLDALIEDKIASSSWREHLGQSESSLVNASTWALMLTGKVLQENPKKSIATMLFGMVRRLGEPLIRIAVENAIKEMGHQFVLGRNIDEAVKRAVKLEKQDYTFSYDVLGEASINKMDADRFFQAYEETIKKLAFFCTSSNVYENPGISVKLSALHPRYEASQKKRVLNELTDRLFILAKMAKDAGMGFNIDAEESERLDLSLDIIQTVLKNPALEHWDGFGVVVQAYSKRALHVISWLYAMAENLDRRIMVRLVKGAYWDSEIKRAQVEGLSDFPVFIRKATTDTSYIVCASKLLGMTDRIYPQFATHNAHTVATILKLVKDKSLFEFQRLYGMGKALHDLVMKKEGTRCRIYAPVGVHSDLLAYLVRRLLENGANSSFVNQILDKSIPAEQVVQDPFDALANSAASKVQSVLLPSEIFGKDRKNSKGWDLHNEDDLQQIKIARKPFKNHKWYATPLLHGSVTGHITESVINPASPKDTVGEVTMADCNDVEFALKVATDWSQSPASQRASVLRKASDCYELNFGELFALLTREAGKTTMDAVGELRESVDFLRYYANEAERLGNTAPCGLFTCISPWNFPLAIFTGQIAAALAAGNGVLAKPAESTSLIAYRAVQLLYESGVPRCVLQFLPGKGNIIGDKLTSDSRVNGVCFTGSTKTAQLINRNMADNLDPAAPLIAETGGLNAMIVDSTSLPEQAVKDIIISAFQSAGQRCSALRILYLQDEIADRFLEMLYGAIEELNLGDPWDMSTDIGPVIDGFAKGKIIEKIENARGQGTILKELEVPEDGTFVSPTVIKVNGIQELPGEVFGPVLFVARFKVCNFDKVIREINQSGYGLTFSIHSRIDKRIQHVIDKLHVGNIYVNRNQIGAVVGCQPFGGEGLSGTGPKAGGPAYVNRFKKNQVLQSEPINSRASCDIKELKKVLQQSSKRFGSRINSIEMSGPTGESNKLSSYGRGTILCLGPTEDDVKFQEEAAYNAGCHPVSIAINKVDVLSILDSLSSTELDCVGAIVFWGNKMQLRLIRKFLAKREGAIIPLFSNSDLYPLLRLERHVCIDTTAAGGNVKLLASQN